MAHQHRQPGRLFRGGELPRLLTMMVMLGVLAMLISLASDAKTWRWLAPDSPPAADGQDRALAMADDGSDNVLAPEPASTGPIDTDAEEQDSAREEFQAVSDKRPLGQEEMAAYWRLMNWERHQSTADMLGRARKDVTFKQLFAQPDKWRGMLVQIPVHLRQTVAADDLAENPLGLKSIHEVWGWNSDSQPYWYWLVVPDLPPGMPEGNSIYEEATFVGYFFKLLVYEDHQGKAQSAPLLIGRLIWHPAGDNPLASRREWTWPWYLAIVLVALFVLRWTLAWTGRVGSPNPSHRRAGGDALSIDQWLDEAESGPRDASPGQGANGHNPQARVQPAPPWETTGPPPKNE